MNEALKRQLNKSHYKLLENREEKTEHGRDGYLSICKFHKSGRGGGGLCQNITKIEFSTANYIKHL